jgi:glycosyltransferase involved in cell wall biosynthesis
MNATDRTATDSARAQVGGADAKPKVSVCVVTYNQELYVTKCLQSLIDQQTSFPIEIIVADDCSTDQTPQIILDYANQHPQIAPIIRRHNVGALRNYLDVHARARGEYVAHIDGDDYALPGKLQAQADALDRDPDCNAVWHRMDLFDDNGAFCSGTTADLSSFSHGRVEFRDAARMGYVGAHSSLMYRKSARSPVANFAEPKLDFYATLELLSTGHGCLLDEVFGRYRVSAPGSISADFVKERRLAIAHAREFMSRFPTSRHDFGIWAISNAIVDLRRLRSTAWDLIRFFRECRTGLSILDVLRNLRRMKDTQVRWKTRNSAWNS